MTKEQKPRRQDDARQAPVAEAIAVGAAAGGLVLGTMQAAAGESETPATPQDNTKAPETDIVADHAPVQTVAHVPMQETEPVATAILTAPPQPEVREVASDPAQLPEAEVNTSPGLPQQVESQLVSDLSQQMSATITRVMQSAEAGNDPSGLGQVMALEIVQSAQKIVADLDIGSLLSQTEDLGAGIVAQALGATSDIADTVLADLVDLPSSLLGHEGSDMPGGLLADLFYSDGAAETLAIPDLSQAAATLVGDVGGSVGGLLGLSYVEAVDGPNGHGLNALSLL